MKYNFGLILKRKIIRINSSLKAIYLCEEVCLGYEDKNELFCPMTGAYIDQSFPDVGSNRSENCVFSANVRKIIENDSPTNNLQIILRALNNAFSGKYLELGDNNHSIAIIHDKTIIEEANNLFGIQEQKEFNEESMDTESDISKMYQEIKKVIISQDEQIMKILTSLYKNQRVIDSKLDDDMIGKLKENVLIVGPTGTGKTEILTRISKTYNIPIVIANATSLSETGYVGRKVEDLLKDLYLSSNKDLNLAQKGVLVIDEFDKLAEKKGEEKVSRSGVQRSLLKLFDGSTFYFDDIAFDTSKLTIVGLGAFSNIKEKEDYQTITTEDLVKYGIMQELIGRFSKVIKMNSLSKEDLKKILIESKLSPLNTYKTFFDEEGISFTYTEDFIDYIAEKAEKLDTGARSLKTIFDDQISGALFHIFSGDYQSIELKSPTKESNQSYVLKK